jgi:hypothetical protein
MRSSIICTVHKILLESNKILEPSAASSGLKKLMFQEPSLSPSCGWFQAGIYIECMEYPVT